MIQTHPKKASPFKDAPRSAVCTFQLGAMPFAFDSRPFFLPSESRWFLARCEAKRKRRRGLTRQRGVFETRDRTTQSSPDSCPPPPTLQRSKQVKQVPLASLGTGHQTPLAPGCSSRERTCLELVADCLKRLSPAQRLQTIARP